MIKNVLRNATRGMFIGMFIDDVFWATRFVIVLAWMRQLCRAALFTYDTYWPCDLDFGNGNRSPGSCSDSSEFRGPLRTYSTGSAVAVVAAACSGGVWMIPYFDTVLAASAVVVVAAAAVAAAAAAGAAQVLQDGWKRRH